MPTSRQRRWSMSGAIVRPSSTRRSTASTVKVWIETSDDSASEAQLDPKLRFGAASFRGCDFARASLLGAELRGVDCAGASFAGTRLDGVQIADCSFEGGDFTDARVARVDLERTRLDRVNFAGVRFAGGSFEATTIVEAEWRDAEFDGLAFREISLASLASPPQYARSCRFDRCDLTNLDLRGVDWSSSVFTECRLRRRSVSDGGTRSGRVHELRFVGRESRGGQLGPRPVSSLPARRGPIRRGPDSRRNCFAEAHLEDADFGEVVLSKVDFREAVFPRAAFFGAVLTDVDFSGAILDGADFRRSTLDSVVFSGSRMADASFEGATLDHCDFEEGADERSGVPGSEAARLRARRRGLHDDVGTRRELRVVSADEGVLSGHGSLWSSFFVIRTSRRPISRTPAWTGRTSFKWAAERQTSSAPVSRAPMRAARISVGRCCGERMFGGRIFAALSSPVRTFGKQSSTRPEWKRVGLGGANCEEASFRNADARFADCSHAVFRRADLSSACFRQSVLHGVDDEGARWRGADTKHADRTDKELAEAGGVDSTPASLRVVGRVTAERGKEPRNAPSSRNERHDARSGYDRPRLRVRVAGHSCGETANSGRKNSARRSLYPCRSSFPLATRFSSRTEEASRSSSA